MTIMPTPSTVNRALSVLLEDRLGPDASHILDLSPEEIDESKARDLVQSFEDVRLWIDNELKTRCSKINRRLNSLLPIAKLPAELLDDIFLSTFPTGRSITTGRLKKFALVCHHWWIHVRRSALLWSCIDLETGMESVKRHLSKAGDGPLDVYIPLARSLQDSWKFRHGISKPYTGTFDMAPFLHPIMEHSGRWRTLSIKGPMLSEMDPGLMTSLSTELEALRVLRIHSYGRQDQLSRGPIVLVGGARLRMLDLYGVPPMKCMRSGFSHLTDLSVRDAYIVEATNTFYGILKLSASSIVSVNWIAVHDAGNLLTKDFKFYFDSPLSLPLLKTLNVATTRDAVLVALGALRTPALEHMQCTLDRSPQSRDYLQEILKLLVHPQSDSPCYIVAHKSPSSPALDIDMSARSSSLFTMTYDSSAAKSQTNVKLESPIWSTLFASLSAPSDHVEHLARWSLTLRKGPLDFIPILRAFPAMTRLCLKGDHARDVVLATLCHPDPNTQRYLGRQLEWIAHYNSDTHVVGAVLDNLLELVGKFAAARKLAYSQGLIQREAEIWMGMEIYDAAEGRLRPPDKQ